MWCWAEYSNLNIIDATDDLCPVVIVDLLDPESFSFVRAELVVQDRIHIDDNIMLLGGFGQFEKFFLVSVLRTSATLLVKLAEVIDVVDVIADTLRSSNTLDTRVKLRIDSEEYLVTSGLRRRYDRHGSARSEQRWI